MNQTLAKIIVTAMALTGLIFLIQVSAARVDLEIQDMKAEHACIGKYVSQEIPRNQIGQGNGQCWIKESYKGL